MFLHPAAVRALVSWKRSLRPAIRPGGARRKLLVFLVLVFVGLAILPYIVAKTPLRNSLLAAALPGGAVRLSAADASLNWFAGPSLDGVAIIDSAGGPLIQAERINTDRTPLNLLLNNRDLGLITVTRPTVYLKTRPDGSNLEDALAAITTALTPATNAPAENGPTARTTLAINLVEGTILIDDVATGHQWRAEGVNLQLDNRAPSGGLTRALLSGRIVETANPAAPIGDAGGRFSIAVQPADGGRNELTLQAESVSLAVATPWLRRMVTLGECSGMLSGQGTATWSSPASAGLPSDLATSGTLAIDRLYVTAPSLHGDRIQLSRLELPWRVTPQQPLASSRTTPSWSIDDLRIRCDVGEVAVRGSLDADLAAARHSLDVRGALDLARLAAMLPQTIRLREGTAITSGTIELAGQYRPNEHTQLITGSLRAAQLAATTAGRPVTWDQPVNASFSLRRSPGTLQLDSLKCDSQFLKFDAAGTSQHFSANLSFDLNQLAEQLGQFIDLSGKKLGGTGTASLTWQQQNSAFHAKANARLTGVAVTLGEDRMWSEPSLDVEALASGLIDPLTNRPNRVDQASLLVQGNGDRLNARLTGAVAISGQPATWPLTINATGRIAQWLTRLRPWFAPDPWRIDGQTELLATANIASQSLELTKVEVAVTDMRATAPGWNIHEPVVKLAGDARWNGATNELSANAAQLVTSTVSLAAQGIRYRAGDAALNQLTGAAAFRADLARMAAWRAPNSPNQPAPYQAKGELTGNLRFAQQADRLTAEISVTALNAALAAPVNSATSPYPASQNVPVYQTIWQEPSLNLRGLAIYQPASDRLSFEQFQVESNTLQATATGTVDKLSAAAEVNAAGDLRYDLAQLTPLLRPYLGNGVQLVGKEQARFAMAGKLAGDRGPQAKLISLSTNDPYRATQPAPPHSPQSSGAPHWSRRLRAQLELPWSGANVYGLPVGPGRLAAMLGDGAVRVEPLSLAVGEGTLTAAPHVHFDPQPAELVLPPGPLLTNVRISPEVSEAMLKYVAPVLSGTTQSEGHFSLQLDGASVPLADSKKADIAGKLSVHSVRVVPGDMANQLIGVARQIEALAKRRDPAFFSSPDRGGVGEGAPKPQVTLLAVRDQQVNFKVIEGRVHHQNLEFQVNDITLRSQGSVGFDQTVQLTLQVPIQDAWIAKEPLLAGFKGQALQIPVGGTLARPQIDARAIASLSQQLLQGAAQQAVGGELNKALDKLFKSR